MVKPETENSLLDTLAWLMLTETFPVLETETTWETFLPTTMLPKLKLEGFTWMAGWDGGAELLELLLAVTNPEQPLKATEISATTDGKRPSSKLPIFRKNSTAARLPQFSRPHVIEAPLEFGASKSAL